LVDSHRYPPNHMSRNARIMFLYKFGSEHCGEKRSVSEAPSGPAAEARSAGAGPRGCLADTAFFAQSGAWLPLGFAPGYTARRPARQRLKGQSLNLEIHLGALHVGSRFGS